jgi:phage I-like protein
LAKGAARVGDIAWASTAIAAVPPADGSMVSTVQLFAMGQRPSRNGKPPLVRVDDLAHANEIVAATAVYHGSNDPVVDYDHQTFFGARPGVGGQAKASGWMRRIFAGADGIFAEVEWTPAAASALKAREYRYISPAFQHDADGRVLAIVNAGLTNTPSLDLAAVASATTEGAIMNLSAIAEALGLGGDAGQDEILRAIANLSGYTAKMTAVASALGVAEGADLAAAAAALKTRADAGAGEPDPAKYVPVASVAALQTSVQSLQAQLDTLGAEKRTAKIEAAQAEGRLPPALVAHASGIVDEVSLDAFLAALPKGGLGVSAVTGAVMSEGGLDADQVALCAAMGWDQAAYAAQLKAEGN